MMGGGESTLAELSSQGCFGRIWNSTYISIPVEGDDVRAPYFRMIADLKNM